MAITRLAIIFFCAPTLICSIKVGDQATIPKLVESSKVHERHQKPVTKLENKIAEVQRSWPVPQGTAPRFNAMAAEFIATSLYIVAGCGTLMGIRKDEGSFWRLQVALTFALVFTSLSYAIGHYSGTAQINPAITVAMVFNGRITIAQGVLNFIFQVLGCIAGSVLLLLIYPKEKDLTGNLALNKVEDGWANGWNLCKVLVYEILMSFGLCFVVLETATNPMSWANSVMAPAAIGGMVFLSHAVLMPIDGCSINPARSLGPAVIVKCLGYTKKYTSSIDSARFLSEKDGDFIAAFENHWVFWVGPMSGGLIAAGISAAFQP